MLRLCNNVVKWTWSWNIEGIIGIEGISGRSIPKISKYRDTTKYRYRIFTSIAILRYIEYRTSTTDNHCKFEMLQDQIISHVSQHLKSVNPETFGVFLYQNSERSATSDYLRNVMSDMRGDRTRQHCFYTIIKQNKNTIQKCCQASNLTMLCCTLFTVSLTAWPSCRHAWLLPRRKQCPDATDHDGRGRLPTAPSRGENSGETGGDQGKRRRKNSIKNNKRWGVTLHGWFFPRCLLSLFNYIVNVMIWGSECRTI